MVLVKTKMLMTLDGLISIGTTYMGMPQFLMRNYRRLDKSVCVCVFVCAYIYIYIYIY